MPYSRLTKIRSSRGAMHFKAGSRGGPTPEVRWPQFDRDRPRRQRRQAKLKT